MSDTPTPMEDVEKSARSRAQRPRGSIVHRLEEEDE
jgi:hypothetical protein